MNERFSSLALKDTSGDNIRRSSRQRRDQSIAALSQPTAKLSLNCEKGSRGRFFCFELKKLNNNKSEMQISFRKESIKMRNLNHFTKILSTTMLLALLFAVLIAGCGNDNNSSPNGPTPVPTPDTTPPTVLSTNPINGATGVALINVTFSEPMDAPSISTASFAVKGPGVTAVAGAVSYDAANNRASFVPTNALVSATAFTGTIMITAKDVAGNALASNYVWNFSSSAAATVQLPVVLVASVDYAVLAGATITNTGATKITGDVGLSPGSSVGGFPPGIIVGTKHISDISANNAKLDLTTAYNNAAGRTLGPVSVSGNLGGMTLPPGLYKSTSGLAISSGDLTLDAKGNANAVWIFQMASTLITTSGRKVILSGGAKAANIFWQVGTSATLGTTSVFKGTIMADQSITMNTGAVLEGRVLARIGAITMNGNTIVRPLP